MLNIGVVLKIIGVFLFILIIGLGVKAIKDYAPDILSNCEEEYTLTKTIRSSQPFNETRLDIYFPGEPKIKTTTGVLADAACAGFWIETTNTTYFLCNDGKLYEKQRICKGHSLKELSTTAGSTQENLKTLDALQKTQYLNSSSP